jgi:hypothetical protein
MAMSGKAKRKTAPKAQVLKIRNQSGQNWPGEVVPGRLLNNNLNPVGRFAFFPHQASFRLQGIEVARAL